MSYLQTPYLDLNSGENNLTTQFNCEKNYNDNKLRLEKLKIKNILEEKYDEINLAKSSQSQNSSEDGVLNLSDDCTKSIEFDNKQENGYEIIINRSR